MKAATLIGAVLIVIGIISLAYGGITYTRKKEVVEVGPISAKVETQEKFPLPPVVGGIALVGGIVLVAVGARRK